MGRSSSSTPGRITHPDWDVRWLAYSLATTIHETASTMWPIEEYGKGKGQPYGVPDPDTGEAYYGRGFVQLTWKDNYQKMTPIVDPLFPGEPIDLVKKPAQALDPHVAAAIMYQGMAAGSFRTAADLRQVLQLRQGRRLRCARDHQRRQDTGA